MNIKQIMKNKKVVVISALLITILLAGAWWYFPPRMMETGPMVIPRSGHTATLLEDGRVLIAGGCNARVSWNGYLNQCELYDPTKNVFVKTGDLSAPNSDGKTILLSDGRVLLSGGGTTHVTSNAEIYYPKMEKWTKIKPMHSPRWRHTVTKLQDGRVLIVGGGIGGGISNTAEIFDPITNCFAQVATMNKERAAHTAALLPDGRVLIAGGYGYPRINGKDCTPNYKAEIFSPTTNTFTYTVEMPYMTDCASVRLGDGTILVNCFIFDYKTNTCKNFDFDSYKNASFFKIDDKHILEINDYSSSEWYIFDLQTKKIQIFDYLNHHKRGDFKPTQLKDGSIFLSGGYAGRGHYKKTADRLYLK